MAYVDAIFLVWLLTLLIAFINTPLSIRLLAYLNIYKNSDTKDTLYGTKATDFNAIRNKTGSVGKQVPRMGGFVYLLPMLLIGTVLAIALDSVFFTTFLFIFYASFIIGMYDDLVDVSLLSGHITLRDRIAYVTFIGLLIGTLLYLISMTTIGLPGGYVFDLGVGMIPFAAIWFLLWYAGAIIDGIDGLSGTQIIIIFSALTILAAFQFNIPVLFATVLILAVTISWLWSNINPAKAYITESGMMPLLIAFAYLSLILGTNGGDGIWFALVVGLLFILTWMSNVVQLLYRWRTGKKLLRVAPIHHHFEAKGMPSSSVVLRYLLITLILSITAIFGILVW